MRNLLIILSLIAAPAMAQNVNVPSTTVPAQAMGYGQPGQPWTPVSPDTPLPTGGKQENFTLVTGNTPVAPVTVYGGSYVFNQTCATYGTVTLRYRGPNGSTMLTLASKTASDTGGGTMVTLGSGAIVDATVTGTTGCSAQIARVP